MAVTHLYGEQVQPWDRNQIGGYGLAIEALADLCGCAPAEAMWVVMTNDINEAPLPTGWCNMTDGGLAGDRLYYNGELVAEVTVSQRAFWVARASTVDGKHYRAEGDPNTFSAWQPYTPQPIS